MACPVLIVCCGADKVTGNEATDCRGPPAEARLHAVSSESGENDHCNAAPFVEDHRLLELLELQNRMFQST
jgi:hypothetical protein